MFKAVAVKLDEIYVPSKFRGNLDPGKVDQLAESIIEQGLQTPIQVRRDKNRYVLVSGLHRLEAVRLLGEETIQVYLVGAPQH